MFVFFKRWSRLNSCRSTCGEWRCCSDHWPLFCNTTAAATWLSSIKKSSHFLRSVTNNDVIDYQLPRTTSCFFHCLNLLSISLKEAEVDNRCMGPTTFDGDSACRWIKRVWETIHCVELSVVASFLQTIYSLSQRVSKINLSQLIDWFPVSWLDCQPRAAIYISDFVPNDGCAALIIKVLTAYGTYPSS